MEDISVRTDRPNPHLAWLDYGRFAAALSVMCYHYLYNGIRNGKLTAFDSFDPISGIAKYGYLGVDFFFIVSGFVIVYSALDRTPQRFLADRVIRLFPAFLFCMTITTLVSIAFGGSEFAVSLKQYLLNLTMMPKRFGVEPIDGVYWTLYLEIVFYGFVFLTILMRLTDKAQLITELWIAAIVLYFLLDKRFPVFNGYAILFASGIVLALIKRNGTTARSAVTLSICAAIAIFAASQRADVLTLRHGTNISTVVVGTITASFFAITLMLTTTKVGGFKLPFAKTIGGLTYPLYLLHAHNGYILMSYFGSEQHKWWDVGAMMALSLAASYLVLIWVEQAPKRFYRKMFTTLVNAPRDWRTSRASDTVQLRPNDT